MTVESAEWHLLNLAVKAHAEMSFPDAAERQRQTALEQKRQARRKPSRKHAAKPNFDEPKLLPAVPNEDNQPTGREKCPRKQCQSVAYLWSNRERVWRCTTCRMPVRFKDGIAQKFVHRDMSDYVAGGWHRPQSTVTLQNCIRLLGASLLGGPRPSHEVRAELRVMGYTRRIVNEAVTALRIRERQIQRPGPNCWILHQSMRERVEEICLGEIVRFLATEPEKTSKASKSYTKQAAEK